VLNVTPLVMHLIQQVLANYKLLFCSDKRMDKPVVSFAASMSSKM
jgi:hypothetical protein